MMNFSDGELAIAMAAGGRLRQTTSAAQAIVDRKNTEIGRLLARVAVLERENAQLKAERTGRHQQKLAAYFARH